MILQRCVKDILLGSWAYVYRIQGWAKEWSLGSVNSRPAARASQETGLTQPTFSSSVVHFHFHFFHFHFYQRACSAMLGRGDISPGKLLEIGAYRPQVIEVIEINFEVISVL